MGQSILKNSRFWLASLLIIPVVAFAAVKNMPFDIEGVTKLTVDNVRVDGNTISTTNVNGDLTLDMNGTGSVILNDLTATTVPYLDASKKVTSSAVTPTELGYLSGVTGPVATQTKDSRALQNCSINAVATSNVIAITIRDAAGNVPNSVSPCRIAFRSVTDTSGAYDVVSVTSATSLTVANGAALGCTATVSCTLAVWAMNNAGTMVLGVSGNHFSAAYFDEGSVLTSTTMGSSADSGGVMYSTSGISPGVPIRLLGRIVVTPALSFVWSNAVTEVSTVPFKTKDRHSDWISFTPSDGSWNTNTTYTGFWRREGPDMLMVQRVTLSGAPNNTGLTFNLPTGFTMDTTKMLAATGGYSPVLCEVLTIDSGSSLWPGFAVYSSTSAIQLYVWNAAAAAALSSLNFSTTVPITFGANDYVEAKCRFPISGWN